MTKSTGFLGGVLLLGGVSAAAAGVNCKIVMKQLEMGRTVDEVMTTTAASEDEIKKCQEEAAEKKAGGAPAGGTESGTKDAK